MAVSIGIQKIKFIFYFFCALFFIIALRLYYLGVYQRDSWYHLGERNFLRVEVIYPSRGNVVDCNNRLLATNRPAFDLYWIGGGSKYLSSAQSELLKTLENILEKNILSNEKLMKQIRFAASCSNRVLLAKEISFDALCRISEQCSQSSNLVIVNHFIRTYPYGQLASHILGFLGKLDAKRVVGKSGLEKIFNEELSGTAGYEVLVTNAAGRILEMREHKEPQRGSEIKLTLDLDAQQIAEKLFEPSQSGAFILLDPQDGAIKAAVSYPNFDPNIFLKPLSLKEWEEQFSGESPFLNRCINALYPPASLFKLVTFAAGLEEGIINYENEFHCRGYTEFCGRRYYCMRHWGHGVLSPKEAIAHSCNIPCYYIARHISIDSLANYAHRFGLGRQCNFLLSDSRGLVPTCAWKKIAKGENWWSGETLSCSIGQSYLLVTPLQIARMIGAICSGNLVRPRILVEEEVQKEPLSLKVSTIRFLRQAMKEAVPIGSAQLLKSLENFTIYAKTGTAQTSNLKREVNDQKSLEHGWCASFFSYKGQKPLVIVAIVEHGRTAGPALALTKKFLTQYAGD